MRVAVCYTKINRNGVLICNAFHASIENNKDIAHQFYDDNYKEINKDKYDLIVQVCDNSPVDDRNCFRGFLKDSGIPRLIIDTGCFNNKREYPCDLDRYVTIGFNGIKAEGKYFNENSNSSRCEKLKWKEKPWRTDGKYALVFGQKRFGLSVWEYDVYDSINEAISYFNTVKIPVLFKPHILEKSLPSGKYEIPPYTPNLSDIFIDIRCAYGVSTNALVESIYNGIPSITNHPRSMAYDMCSHKLDIDGLIRPDRTQWLFNLARTQWHYNEIVSGECWLNYREYVKCV